MNEEIKRTILEKIKEYCRIIITRHQRPDGDAVGSSMGLARLIKLSFPEKEVFVINEDYADYTSFLGKEDEQVPDSFYEDSLVIVVDTATQDRISNKKYALGKEIIKIDHHISVDEFGDYSWVEENRSAACELIADFYLTFKDELKIDSECATLIYAGIVTDSGRFRYESVSGETLRLSGALLDVGINTDRLYANLYLDSLDRILFNASVAKKIKMTENGVAYIKITKSFREKCGITMETASNIVFMLDSIKGSIIWLALIENDDHTIRVRLRSRFVTINTLAEKYHGGGHACASGATLYSRKEEKALLKDADDLIKDYKANNGDWL